MQHLKKRTILATIATRGARQAAARLLSRGRELRREAVGASGSKPEALVRRAGNAHKMGLGLRESVASGRQDRRSLALASAMLNGKSYKDCERRVDPNTPKPDTESIARHICESLPKAERERAGHIVGMWLKAGSMSLRHIRENLGNLLELDKKKAELEQVQRSLNKAEVEFDRAQRDYDWSRAYLESWADKVAALKAQSLSLRKEVEHQRQMVDNQAEAVGAK